MPQQNVLTEAPLPPAVETFAELHLDDRILASLNRAGFTKPTPIQAAMIPHALAGRDMVGQARTGTGKTGAFLIPIFQKLVPGERGPQALIMAPTRELAQQIGDQILLIGYNLPFRHVCITGGELFEPQVSALRKGVDIVVGTPGRLIDLYKKRILNFDHLRTIILDEADRMLDFGFRPDIEYILRRAPKERQTLMLSATYSDDILYLTKRYMRDPEMLRISRDSLTVPSIEQYYRTVERPEKFAALCELVRTEKPGLAIIFCNTRALAKRLSAKLVDVGLNAHEIHGDLEQKRRNTVMGKFRKGIVHLLVATDVASRGIDVDGITHIVNYDVPQRIEDYVHRIGRTGRMERAGRAVTFVTHEEGPILTEIEQLINQMLIPWTPGRGPVVQPADATVPASAEDAGNQAAPADEGAAKGEAMSIPEDGAPAYSDAPAGDGQSGDREGDGDSRRRRSRGRRRSGGGGEERPSENTDYGDTAVGAAPATEAPPAEGATSPEYGRRDGSARGSEDRYEQSDRDSRSDRGGRRDRSDRGDPREQSERTDRGDRDDRGERSERGDRGERGNYSAAQPLGRRDVGLDRTGPIERSERGIREARGRRVDPREQAARADLPGYRRGRDDNAPRAAAARLSDTPAAGYAEPAEGWYGPYYFPFDPQMFVHARRADQGRAVRAGQPGRDPREARDSRDGRDFRDDRGGRDPREVRDPRAERSGEYRQERGERGNYGRGDEPRGRERGGDYRPADPRGGEARPERGYGDDRGGRGDRGGYDDRYERDDRGDRGGRDDRGDRGGRGGRGRRGDRGGDRGDRGGRSRGGRGGSGGSRGGWRQRERHRRGESIMVYRRHHAYGSDGKSITLNGPALSVEEARTYLVDFENFAHQWWDFLPADFEPASDQEMQAVEAGGSEAIPRGATAMQDESPEEPAEPVSLIDMGELPPEELPPPADSGASGEPQPALASPLDEIAEEMATQAVQPVAIDLNDLFESDGPSTAENTADNPTESGAAVDPDAATDSGAEE